MANNNQQNQGQNNNRNLAVVPPHGAALTLSEEERSLLARVFSEAQVNFLLQRTPKEEIKTRPGRGGGQWSYIEVTYVIDQLNKVFSFMWDFDVISREIFDDEIVVEGRLVVTAPNGERIAKTQFGGADIKKQAEKKAEWVNGSKTWVPNPQAGKPVSIADDCKAAASDALKKCASLLGIGLDLYGRERLDDAEHESEPAPPHTSTPKPQPAPAAARPQQAAQAKVQAAVPPHDVMTGEIIAPAKKEPWEVFSEHVLAHFSSIGVDEARQGTFLSVVHELLEPVGKVNDAERLQRIWKAVGKLRNPQEVAGYIDELKPSAVPRVQIEGFPKG